MNKSTFVPILIAQLALNYEERRIASHRSRFADTMVAENAMQLTWHYMTTQCNAGNRQN